MGTDIGRHSSGYWRSIFIFTDKESGYDVSKIRVPINIWEWLDKRNLKHSYCNYGATDEEREHVTFRVKFDTIPQMRSMERFLKKNNLEFTNKGYDEEPYCKEAYVIGTKLWKMMLASGYAYDKRFWRLMLHGCFNDMGFNYREEYQYYDYLLRAMQASVFGMVDDFKL
jgi:hypothetical protein